MISAKGVNGTVHFDGQFVTIERTGFLARLTVGKGQKRIPLRSIASIQWKPPGLAVNGYIEFSVAGGNESRSRFGTATFDATKNENAVVVMLQQVPAFDVLRAAIDGALAGNFPPRAYGATQPPPPAPPVPPGWYPDPRGAQAQRFWDGMRWTDHTAPAPRR